ncbi:MBL fold metallo-hydrolase [Streptomyces sp. JNUCC 63]
MTCEEVVPGLWRIPVEIPIPALGTVNVHLLELDGGGAALIDTGWDDERSYAGLCAGIEATGHTVEEIACVVVTHAHPDHLGLAGRIQAASGAPVLLHEEEVRRLRGGATGPHGYRAAVEATFPRWGVPVGDLDEWTGSSAGILARSWDVPVEPVASGQTLPLAGWDLRAVWTPGHTPGHLCLYEPGHRLLFSGDHVLPRITPVVGMHPAQESDPLAEFMASLDAVAALDTQVVLPAHERVFTDAAERVAELKDHHARRLAEVCDLVAAGAGRTAWEVARLLTWSRPLGEVTAPTRRLALAETQAHLVHLERRGVLARNGGEGGVERWITV